MVERLGIIFKVKKSSFRISFSAWVYTRLYVAFKISQQEKECSCSDLANLQDNTCGVDKGRQQDFVC